MAKKKRQHYVPQVYLKPFTDKALPSDWPQGQPFEPCVWIAQPRMLNSFRRKAPVNILAKTRLYNLRSDDPERPWIEESLNRIETEYEGVQELLCAYQKLSPEQHATLIVFIAALSARTPGSINHRQAFIDDLERIHRAMVSEDPLAEADADRIFAESDEAGRRLIPEWTQAYGDAIARDGFVLVNRTIMDFITSDRPVSHVFLHIDERPISLFPKARRKVIKPNVQTYFSFTPLTPNLAFVRSPLLEPSDFYLENY